MRSLLLAFLCLSLPLAVRAQTPPPAPAPAEAAKPHESALMSVPKKLLEGGTTVLVQLALSVIAGAFFIERLVNLRRDRIAPHRLAVQADALWDDDKFGEILKLCDKQPSSLSRIIAFVVRHRRNSLGDLSRATGDMGSREIRRHLQRAYPLMVAGMLAPLLGLLGTVIGMIETFASVSDSGSLGDAALLAGGISKFLVCTGTGLFIAVPCLASYHFFKTRTISLGHLLEEEVDFILHRWFLTREEEEEKADAYPS